MTTAELLKNSIDSLSTEKDIFLTMRNSGLNNVSIFEPRYKILSLQEAQSMSIPRLVETLPLKRVVHKELDGYDLAFLFQPEEFPYEAGLVYLHSDQTTSVDTIPLSEIDILDIEEEHSFYLGLMLEEGFSLIDAYCFLFNCSFEVYTLKANTSILEITHPEFLIDTIEFIRG